MDEGRLRADITVIGAGIAGASVAWSLLAHDPTRSVILLELEHQPGVHATGRSAAVTNCTSGAVEVCALAAASRGFLEQPDPTVSTGSLLTDRGLLWVADRSAVDQLDPLAATASRLGVTARRIAPDEVIDMVPTLRPGWVAAALYEPDAKSIDVALLLQGYLGAFRRAGGTMLVREPALTLQPQTSGWSVTTATTTIDTGAVVNAAGAWADDVARRAGLVPLGLRPFLRTAFTFPHPDARTWPLVMDVGGSFYFEPEGPLLLASPGDETPVPPSDVRPDETTIALAVDALDRATDLSVRGVRHRWAGLRTFAPDRLPVVGPDPTTHDFYWLAGQGGAGIKTAPALAALLTSAIDGTSLPSELTAVGVDPADFLPGRLR